MTFDVKQFYQVGNSIWNFIMSLVGTTAALTPKQFSSYTWAYVTTEVMSWTLTIGAAMLNIMFMIGIIRQTTNLKDNFTMETFVESMFKVMLGNFLHLNGTYLMKLLFSMASGMAAGFLVSTPPSFEQMDQDLGSELFYLCFGLIYMIVAIVCAGMIFLTVYSRYLNLYLLVATGPIAWSTIPAGHGVSSVASSWIRTFFSKCFEIVIIALAVVIAAAMCRSIDFGTMTGLGELVDGFLQALQNLATMIILTGAVKGADVFMHRAFGL